MACQIVEKITLMFGIEKFILDDYFFRDMDPASLEVYQNKELCGKLNIRSEKNVALERLIFEIRETYSVGRWKGKKTEHFIIGQKTYLLNQGIQAGKNYYYKFRIPFEYLSSKAESRSRKSRMAKWAFKGSKQLFKIKSTYTLILKTKISGVPLKAIDKLDCTSTLMK